MMDKFKLFMIGLTSFIVGFMFAVNNSKDICVLCYAMYHNITVAEASYQILMFYWFNDFCSVIFSVVGLVLMFLACIFLSFEVVSCSEG